MSRKTKELKTRRLNLKNVLLPWGSAFALLFLYYYFIQFPMERSFVKGLDYLRQNKFTKASGEFDKVLKVYPRYEPVSLNLSAYYLRNKDYKKSTDLYNYSRRTCLINAEIFSERGLVYSKYKSNFDQGLIFYNDHVVNNYLSTLAFLHEKK